MTHSMPLDRAAFDVAWGAKLKDAPHEDPEPLWEAVAMTLEYTAIEGAVLSGWSLNIAKSKDFPARFYDYDRMLKEFKIRFQTDVGRNVLMYFRVPGLMRPDLQEKILEHVGRAKNIFAPTAAAEQEGKKEKGKATAARPGRLRKLMKYESAYPNLPLEHALLLAIWVITFLEDKRMHAPIAISALTRILVESDLSPFRSKADINSTLNILVKNRYASYIRAGTSAEGFQLLNAGAKMGAELASES